MGKAFDISAHKIDNVKNRQGGYRCKSSQFPAESEKNSDIDEYRKGVLQEIDKGGTDAVIDVFYIIIHVVHQVANPVFVEIIQMHFDDTVKYFVPELFGCFGLYPENNLTIQVDEKIFEGKCQNQEEADFQKRQLFSWCFEHPLKFNQRPVFQLFSTGGIF